MSARSALVVGPRGLVGHGIAAAFVRDGWQVLGKVKDGKYKAITSNRVETSFEMIEDIPMLAGEGIHVLVLAADLFPGFGSNYESLKRFYENLLSDLIKLGLHHVCLISSASVYGEIGLNNRALESDPLLAESAYGKFKAVEEALVFELCESLGVPLMIARGSSIFGSCPKSEFSRGLVGSISYALVKDVPFLLTTSLSTTRDFINNEYFGDVIRHLLSQDFAGILNIGGDPFSVRELIDVLEKSTQKKLLINQDQERNDASHCVLDCKKLGNILEKSDYPVVPTAVQLTEYQKGKLITSSSILKGEIF